MKCHFQDYIGILTISQSQQIKEKWNDLLGQEINGEVIKYSEYENQKLVLPIGMNFGDSLSIKLVEVLYVYDNNDNFYRVLVTFQGTVRQAYFFKSKQYAIAALNFSQIL